MDNLVWVLVLLLLWMLAAPVYWYLYIWRQPNEIAAIHTGGSL